ncbi:hypothetical protein [Spirosoma flavus]
MKKQFSIKPAQVLKSVSKTNAKAESNNLLKFLSAGGVCCEYVAEFKGISKPVFSL